MRYSLNIGIGGSKTIGYVTKQARQVWGGAWSFRSNTPEDVTEGVVAGKYRLLFFTPETIL